MKRIFFFVCMGCVGVLLGYWVWFVAVVWYVWMYSRGYEIIPLAMAFDMLYGYPFLGEQIPFVYTIGTIGVFVLVRVFVPMLTMTPRT